MVYGSLNDLVCFVSCMFNVTQPTIACCHHFYISTYRDETSTGRSYISTPVRVFADVSGIATFSSAS